MSKPKTPRLTSPCTRMCLTGAKRPTIVNMSWGYQTFYSTVSTINYRGTAYTGSSIDTTTERWNYGLVPLSGIPFATYRTNVRISSV
ncbi:MAG: hypothetical protein ACO3C3_09600, partial [Burkholderiaceae bacterium]